MEIRGVRVQSYGVTANESKRFREVAERAAAAASPQLLSAFRSPVDGEKLHLLHPGEARSP